MIYTLADWAGLRAPREPLPRQVIEALLRLPDLPPAMLMEPPPAPVPTEPEVTLPKPATSAVPPAPTFQPTAVPRAAQRVAIAPRKVEPIKIEPPPLFYPPEAVMQGIEGEVLVGVELDPAGNVLSARLERGSGFAILDEAALIAARSLKSVPGGTAEAVFPVRFQLH